MAPIVEVRDITLRFGGLVAMDRVSFSVPGAGVTALIGPNGAGKTTAFNVISGHLRPQEGTMSVFGQASTGDSPAVLADRGMARSWQDGRIYQDMTVLENLVVARRSPLAETAFLSLLRPGRAAREEHASVAKALSVLDRIGLAPLCDLVAGDISYAEQRLLSVGQLLMRDPRLMLLDEPAAGLDGESIDRLVGIVRATADAGVPVLIVEHSLSVVRAVADTCVFMSNGVVVAQGTPEELLARDDLIDMYFGQGWRA